MADPTTPADAALPVERDEIAVNLMRRAGLDKHKARECEAIVLEILRIAALASPQAAPITQAQPFGWVWLEDGEWQFAKAFGGSRPSSVTALYTHPAAGSHQAPITQEREAFEKCHLGGNKRLTVRDTTTGAYVSPCIEDAWAGWQARAALSSPTVAQAAEGTSHE